MDLGARLKINQVVEQNWHQLLDLAKEVIDCRLDDGIQQIVVSIHSPVARFL